MNGFVNCTSKRPLPNETRSAHLSRPGRLRAAVVTAFVGLAIGACGRTVPHGGVPQSDPTPTAPKAPKPGRVTTVTEATELLPADLDLVVRVDFAKIRADLGAEAADELVDEALDAAKVEGDARATLAEADVVWLGLRLADLELGDHVMVAKRRPKRAPDGKPKPLIEPSPTSWDKSATNTATITRFVHRRSPARAATARIYTVGHTGAVFVSPVEEHSVERLLRMGPDPSRGEPVARGLISVDLVTPKLSPRMRRRLPALAKLVGGVERVRASVDLFGDRLEVRGTIRCKDDEAARKVHQYLTTFTTPASRFAELLGGAKLDRSGASVLVTWHVQRSLISRLLRPTEVAQP